MCMAFTAGYLVYDLILCIIYIKSFGDKLTLLHHTTILIAYFVGIFYEFGTFYMGFFLINEISTPFLNLRWFLLQTNRRDGEIYEWTSYLLALSFLIFRVIFNLVIIEHMTRGFFRFYPQLVSREGLPISVLYFLPILAWIHVLINLYWFTLIARNAINKLLNKKKKKN